MDSLLAGQTLICDADDTLWECNLYFEEAIAEFVAFLNHEHLSPDEIRAVLDTFERANGYGARAFAASLVATFRELATQNDPGDEEQVEQLGLRILAQDLEPIAGVRETLTRLSGHHDLILFTKGEEEEQRLKIARSGIDQFFVWQIITAEKDTDAYAEIVDSLGLDPETTWMIGNSPRSDIYPALAAGLRAIFIPNPHTWHFEHLEFEQHPDWAGRSVELARFSDVLTLFAHD